MKKYPSARIVKPKDLKRPEYRYLKDQGLGYAEIEAGHNRSRLAGAEEIAAAAAERDSARRHGAAIKARFEAGLSTAAEAPEPPRVPMSVRKHEDRDLQAQVDELEERRRREAEARRRRPREIAERFRKALRRGEEDRE